MTIENLEIKQSIDEINTEIQEIWKKIYPIGSIYMSVNSTSPETLFGGEWVTWGQGKFPIGVDPSDETGHWDGAEMTGGQQEITLDVKNIPPHTHQICAHTDVGMTPSGGSQYYPMMADLNFLNQSLLIGYTGEAESFDITPPFISVYMWKRVG